MDNERAVVLVGDAEPLRRSLQDAHRSIAVGDESVDSERNIIFRFKFGAMLAEEIDEEALACLEIIGGESKEIHRDGSIGRERMERAVGVLVFDAIGRAGDRGAFGHADEEAVAVGAADTARDSAIVAERIFEPVADHTISAAGIGREVTEVVGHDHESIASIEIVGIDDSERLVDSLLGHKDGMVGAPRLDAASGDREASGEAVEFLKDIIDSDTVAEMLGIDFCLKFLFERVTDDEDDLAETGADGIVDAIIHNNFAVGADAVQLFEATVAAAHASGKDEKSRLHRQRY